MHLGKLYSNFDSRCKSYNFRINELVAKKNTLSSWEYNYLTEVLISDIWQSWSKFCRELLLSSCRGTIARDGSKIAMLSGDLSWKRLGYLAKQASVGSGVTPTGHSTFLMRKEPTWGDIDVFIRIMLVIQPNNVNTIVTSFGSFTSLKHLQKVRNACAHKNIETLTEILALTSIYAFHKLKFPTEIAWKNMINQPEFAIELWLYEMNLIADLSTSSI